MFSKKNLWFMTLFSIILVMAVYYISTPMNDDSLVSKEVNAGDASAVEVEPSSAINSMRVNRDESLKELNSNKGKEEALEAIIKKDFNYENFVKIDGSNVKIVVDTESHSYDLANKIMKSVQSQFDKKVYITVSFGTK